MSALTVGSGAEQKPYGEEAFRREVGRRIRSARIWRNLSQLELAARAGVSRNFVGAIERGAHGLDAWRLLLLGRALDMPAGRLLGDDTEGDETGGGACDGTHAPAQQAQDGRRTSS